MDWFWPVVLIAILGGPFLAALVFGFRHRDSGAPGGAKAMESNADLQELRNTRDIRHRGYFR